MDLTAITSDGNASVVIFYADYLTKCCSFSLKFKASYNGGPTSSDVEVQHVPVPEDFDLDVWK